MVELLKTSVFDAWLSDLKDRQAVARIAARIDRLTLGNPGDVKPGYRVYYQQRGSRVVLLLCGGDKRTQRADIRQVIKLAEDWQHQDKTKLTAQPKASKKR